MDKELVELIDDVTQMASPAQPKMPEDTEIQRKVWVMLLFKAARKAKK